MKQGTAITRQPRLAINKQNPHGEADTASDRGGLILGIKHVCRYFPPLFGLRDLPLGFVGIRGGPKSRIIAIVILRQRIHIILLFFYCFQMRC
jgi:hypothetical protein